MKAISTNAIEAAVPASTHGSRRAGLPRRVGAPGGWWQRAATRAPGFVLCLLVAAAATALSHVVPLGSAPVLAILIGLVLGSIIGPRAALAPGLAISSSALLRGAVIVLGGELPLGAVLAEGLRSLPVIALTLGGCLLAASALGRRLGVANPLRTLIGVGTGICGASAIAAVTPVIEADGLEVGYAVTTIFLFNVLAVLTFPPLGHLLGMGAPVFGVFSGTAVNDLSSVVAAASAYGDGALRTAVIVKLTRTLMIVPICMVLAHRHQRRASEGQQTTAPAASVLARVPRFLFGFLALAALCTAGIIPHGLVPAISQTATVMITVALAAVGLSINLPALRRTGLRPLALGAALWVTVSLLSLAAQASGMA